MLPGNNQQKMLTGWLLRSKIMYSDNWMAREINSKLRSLMEVRMSKCSFKNIMMWPKPITGIPRLHIYTGVQNVWKRKISRTEKRIKVWISLFCSFPDFQCNYQIMEPTLSDLWVWYHPIPHVWERRFWSGKNFNDHMNNVFAQCYPLAHTIQYEQYCIMKPLSIHLSYYQTRGFQKNLIRLFWQQLVKIMCYGKVCNP